MWKEAQLEQHKAIFQQHFGTNISAVQGKRVFITWLDTYFEFLYRSGFFLLLFILFFLWRIHSQHVGTGARSCLIKCACSTLSQQTDAGRPHPAASPTSAKNGNTVFTRKKTFKQPDSREGPDQQESLIMLILVLHIYFQL